MEQYNIDNINFIYEEEIMKKVKLKPLLSTSDQAKLIPVIYTSKYKLEQDDKLFKQWYIENRQEINYIFNQFIKIFINNRIYFNTSLKQVYNEFTEFLYYA